MPLSPEVSATLERWHQMLASGDLSSLNDLIEPSAQFRSPMVFKPYQGGAAVAGILRLAYGVFQDFKYHRQFACGERDVVLEFTATVNGKEVHGIDMVQFNAGGKITEFVVMVRPHSGLVALAAEMEKGLQAAGMR